MNAATIAKSIKVLSLSYSEDLINVSGMKSAPKINAATAPLATVRGWLPG